MCWLPFFVGLLAGAVAITVIVFIFINWTDFGK